MRLIFFLFATLAFTATGARAETAEEILVTAPPESLPAKGMSKAGVIASYGEPAQKRSPVGGGSVHQPPITRWDYEGFVVVFENGHVVDAVQKGNPAPIKVRSGLGEGSP